MSFEDSLPPEALDWRFGVVVPEGGLRNTILQFLDGGSATLDLPVERDFRTWIVRLMIEPKDLIRHENNAFRIESAPGVLLNEDGQETDNLVTATGLLSLVENVTGMPAGLLTIWNRDIPDSNDLS